ncbi:hypothetical protein OROHE_006200 [Orobanche hederae]
MGLPAATRGLGVHWFSAAAAKTEEVSSSDSDGSLFIHNEFGMCRTITEIDHLGGSRKRSSDQFESKPPQETTSPRRGDHRPEPVTTTKMESTREKNSDYINNSPLFLKKASKNRTLSILQKQKLALAKQLNLRPRQVEVWFQNRRARLVLLICVTKVAKSAFDKALAEHEDIDDVVGSEEPIERDHDETHS